MSANNRYSDNNSDNTFEDSSGLSAGTSSLQFRVRGGGPNSNNSGGVSTSNNNWVIQSEGCYIYSLSSYRK